MDGDTLARVGYLAIILVALGGWALVEFRQRLGQALRYAMAWGLIFVGVMAGYGLWNDISNQALPRQILTAEGEIEVPRSADGHYYVKLAINGTPVTLMVDTGASGLVLSLDDAERLGIAADSLQFRGTAMTANGPVRTAQVTLPVIELGPFRNENFRAYVNEGAMDGSLLGMDYLGQFRMQFAGDQLILRQ